MTGEPSLGTFHISDDAAGQLLNVLGEAVIATDPQGTILLWNRAAEALYGYSQDEVIGRAIYDITVPELSASDAREIMTRLTSGETWSGEFPVRDRAGRTFMVEVTDVPVADSRGSLRFIVGLSRDISARIQLQQERDQLHEEKEAISRSRSQFLTLVSHELRTPLTAILGFSELLTRDDRVLDGTVTKEALIDIRDAARQMRRLLEDLLAISRSLSSTDRTVNLEPVVLGRILDAVFEEHRFQHPARKVDVTYPADLPLVLANPLYLEHVIVNLLSDAERYSPSTEAIGIVVEPGQSLITIKVLDRARLPQIAGWEPPLPSPASAVPSGYGTEFSICRTLIEIQNGSFSREPRDGGGNVYRITLPRSH